MRPLRFIIVARQLFGSAYIDSILNHVSLGQQGLRVLIDNWILKRRKYFGAFLAGFTDAEGYISIVRKKAYFGLGNYNKLLLNQIHRELLRNKIICARLAESKLKGRRCFGKYFHNQNYWHFQIHRKESLLLLFNLIGPHLKHSQRKKGLKWAKRNIILWNKLFDNID